MSDKARKKEKQRLKREKKRLALRKAGSVSPYKKLAGGELIACYVNSDWRERGQAVPFVLRRAPGAGLAAATFMVDLWCAGLKDAWGRAHIARDEFERMVDTMDERMDGTMAPAPLAEVAGIVAGSVRFAVQNGFRLPAHYQRWLAFLGPDALDWQNADLSDFGVEGGKLLWVGPMFDLRRRLVACTPEQFLARQDVEAITGPDDEFEGDVDWTGEGDEHDEIGDEIDDENDEEAIAEAGRELDRIIDRMRDAVKRWCFAEKVKPSGQLDLALSLMFFTGAKDIATEEGDVIEAPPTFEAGREAVAASLAALTPTERRELEEATRQLQQFAMQYPNPADMFKTIGVETPGELEGPG
jgi:hypothetical protein